MSASARPLTSAQPAKPLEAKAISNRTFMRQYVPHFLIELTYLCLFHTGSTQYSEKEKGHARALLQAYRFAFTHELAEKRLNHRLIKELQKFMMGRTLAQPLESYRDACSFYPLHIFAKTSQKVVNPSATLKGFFEFVDKWMIRDERSIHMINFKPSKPGQLEYILNFNKTYLAWAAYKNSEGVKLEKVSLENNEWRQLVEQLLKDGSYTCHINTGEEDLVRAGGYANVREAITDKMHGILYGYNIKMSKAETAEEKLRIIVAHAQWITQLQPFQDAKVRISYILLNRALHQQGMPLSMMSDPARFEGFDLESLVACVKEGQAAFQSLQQQRAPVFSSNPLALLATISGDFSDLREDIDNFIKVVTTANPATTPHLRKIVAVAPGETARLSAAHAQDTDLLVRLQIDRRAVVFRDSLGNVSVTHLDHRTNFNFVKREARWMKTAYTIDIVRDGEDKSELTKTRILPAIQKELGGPFKNAKGNEEIRSTKTSNLLVKQGKLQMPLTKDLDELMPGNGRVDVAKTNLLADSTITEGARPFQLRLFERLILQISTKAEEKLEAALVYDDHWTGVFPLLPAATRYFIRQANLLRRGDHKSLRIIIDASAKEAFGVNFSSLSTQLLLSTLPMKVELYLVGTSKNLYSKLFNFFKAPEATKLPERAVHLIQAYCESEEETADVCLKRGQA